MEGYTTNAERLLAEPPAPVGKRKSRRKTGKSRPRRPARAHPALRPTQDSEQSASSGDDFQPARGRKQKFGPPATGARRSRRLAAKQKKALQDKPQ